MAAWPASLRFEHGVFESRYRVVRSLGDGGMGEVVLAEHVDLGKRVAIKMIHPQYVGDPESEERFLLETRAAARIKHDNVVGISDFGRTADGRMFFVMEYLEGEDLAKTLRREGPLPWRRVVHLTRHVLAGVAELHRRGVIHRDIKPGNCVRVQVDGDADFVKLCDFGLAKLFRPEDLAQAPKTMAGVFLGTPGYMAPEIEAGQAPDPRVDLYSVGVLMVRLLTGKLPDEGGLRLLADAEDVPPPLHKLIARALREDPDERFQTADAFEEALAQLAATAGPSSRATRRPQTAGRLQPPIRGEVALANLIPSPPTARPITGPGPRPVTADQLPRPQERATQELHSGLLMASVRGGAPVTPEPPTPRPRRAPSSRLVVLLALVAGALLGGAAALWRNMSLRTGTPGAPAAEAKAPVAAPAEAEAEAKAPVAAPPAAPVAAPGPAEAAEARSASPRATTKKKRTQRPKARASGHDSGGELKNPF
jgi:serine/threonine-protein kinase